MSLIARFLAIKERVLFVAAHSLLFDNAFGPVHANVGVVRRIGSRRKDFFFEKKKQKTFSCFGFGFAGWAQPK